MSKNVRLPTQTHFGIICWTPNRENDADSRLVWKGFDVLEKKTNDRKDGKRADIVNMEYRLLRKVKKAHKAKRCPETQRETKTSKARPREAQISKDTLR